MYIEAVSTTIQMTSKGCIWYFFIVNVYRIFIKTQTIKPIKCEVIIKVKKNETTFKR